MATNTEHTMRNNLMPGMTVDIVLKKDQKAGILTKGVIRRILTNAPVHTRGIKVELENGAGIGRVQHIYKKEESKEDILRFYQAFLSLENSYALWDVQVNQFVIYDHKNQKTNSDEKTVLLFEKPERLLLFIVGTCYIEERYKIKPLSSKDLFIIFQQEQVDYFRIEGERKISYSNLLKVYASI